MEWLRIKIVIHPANYECILNKNLCKFWRFWVVCRMRFQFAEWIQTEILQITNARFFSSCNPDWYLVIYIHWRNCANDLMLSSRRLRLVCEISSTTGNHMYQMLSKNSTQQSTPFQLHQLMANAHSALWTSSVLPLRGTSVLSVCRVWHSLAMSDHCWCNSVHHCTLKSGWYTTEESRYSHLNFNCQSAKFY